MKILVDMNLSPAWADFLTDRQIPSVHWSSIGPVDAPDSSIMAYAAEHGYAVLTRDLDFSTALARHGAPKPSVIQIRAERTAPHQVGSQVLSALRHKEAEVNQGALLTIKPGKSRIHLLPLRRASDL